MPFFQFGFILKKRREQLGYTQEDLADGICSVATLSRIENGERMPTKEHFEMLIQRLGYSDAALDAYVNEKDFQQHELKFQIRQAIILGKTDAAEVLLKRYQSNIVRPSSIEKQFMMLCEGLVHGNRYGVQERLDLFEAAIKLTCPQYARGEFPLILSFEEISILNNIAICHSLMKDYEGAIHILYGLKRHYEVHFINTEEILRTQLMIYCNLSKFLGCVERYDECIEICDQGIRIARETGRCAQLAKMLYNRAWALVRRNRAGDMLAAEESARLAYYMALVMAQDSSAVHYRRFLEENFPGEPLLR